MQAISINWWAILAAVVSNFVIGGAWYSPGLFVTPWLEMSGVDKSEFDSGLPKALVGDLASAVVMALVLDPTASFIRRSRFEPWSFRHIWGLAGIRRACSPGIRHLRT
jgi:hypothetical protein